MAGDAKKLQPIIVKRIKKGGHAAHGGAWKIAYADFVTAMMAFFLLMWLLGSTTEGDKKGIADYFASPLKVAMQGGSGSGDASHVIKAGGKDLTRADGQVRNGDHEQQRRTYNIAALKAEQIRAEAERLQGLKQTIEERIAASEKFKELSNQIRLDMTRDGLRIQIVDDQNRPMFDAGSAVVKPYMRDLLRAIGEILQDVPNLLTLEGHTDASAYAGGALGYSNWELSADRANASRRELMASGLPELRVLRIQGLAYSQPLDLENLESPMNRRISIIVMNREAEDRVFKPVVNDAPEDDLATETAPTGVEQASSAPQH